EERNAHPGGESAPMIYLDQFLNALVGLLPTPLREALEETLARRWAAALLVLLAALSAIPLSSVVGWPITLAVMAGVALAVWLAVAKLSEWWTSLVVVLGAVALPWLCLITFDWLLRVPLRWLGLGLWPSLVLAGIVFMAAALAYLLVWRERRIAAVVVALV